MPKKQLVVCVDGICIEDGRFLLFRRAVEPFKGYWHVVGGHVEENETFEDALRREFLEEANLAIKVGGLVAVRMEETSDRIKLIFAFHVLPISRVVSLNGEHDAYGWFRRFPAKCVYDYSKHVIYPRLKAHGLPASKSRLTAQNQQTSPQAKQRG